MVRSWACPCERCGGPGDTVTVFSPSASVSPVSIIPPVSLSDDAVTRRTDGQTDLQTAMVLRESWNTG